MSVKTPRRVKLYVLYSEEAPYKIVKNEQDIKIVSGEGSEVGI
jgi:hypothetical protein